MGDARKAALSALEKCRRAQAWSDAVLGSVMDAAGLEGPDRGLCAALCYGVLQNRSWLDYAVAQSSSLPLQRIEPKVLDILRLSLYQLFFLKRVPPYAAVNEGVSLCRAVKLPRAAGFVNAVLRKCAAMERMPEPGPETALPERLSILYSHPRWLVELLSERLGPEEAEAFLRADNAVPPLALQTNTLRISPPELAKELSAEGVETELSRSCPETLFARNTGDLRRTSAFQNGKFYVQDPAAHFAVLAAAPQTGERILDLCAAPGGKSFAAAIAAEGGAELTACDLHENKLKRVREGAARLGVSLETLAADARENRPDWNAQFDLVIADVPCSGLGVIRKKPDIRWKDPTEFNGLPAIQRAILDNAARCVRPGGRLLYATCTIRAEENELVAGAFLDAHTEFGPLDFRSPWGDASERGMLQLWPQRQGTDGFFISLMRRTK